MSRTTNRSSRVKAATLVGAVALALNVAPGAVAFADTPHDSGSVSHARGIAGGDGGHGDDGKVAISTYVNSAIVTNTAATTVTALCNNGDVATGGGFSLSAANTILTSAPVPNGPGSTPTAWTVVVGTPLGTGETLTAYVVCVHQTQNRY